MIFDLNVVTTVIDTVEVLLSSDTTKKFICGTYEDGTTRSLVDALKGEVKSPKKKMKGVKKKNKQKKKDKKKKKY